MSLLEKRILWRCIIKENISNAFISRLVARAVIAHHCFFAQIAQKVSEKYFFYYFHSSFVTLLLLLLLLLNEHQCKYSSHCWNSWLSVMFAYMWVSVCVWERSKGNGSVTVTDEHDDGNVAATAADDCVLLWVLAVAVALLPMKMKCSCIIQRKLQQRRKNEVLYSNIPPSLCITHTCVRMDGCTTYLEYLSLLSMCGCEHVNLQVSAIWRSAHSRTQTLTYKT